MTWIVVAFYKFVKLSNCANLRIPLLEECSRAGLCGTVLLAPEGINATLAGTEAGIQQVLDFIRTDSRLADLSLKWSTAPERPFDRMKVKLKREIVTFGQGVDPTKWVGTYVAPQDWNQLLDDPEVLVIDTRNAYEVAIGSFEGAINPKTDSFRDFPSYVNAHLNPEQHRRIAMFCTGGIRCEKATAYLIEQGFEEVYHLEGGILQYLEEVPAAESRWRGECFVFDQRVALRLGLIPGNYDMCQACGHPISAADKAADAYEEGVSCPHCSEVLPGEPGSDKTLAHQP